MQQGTVHFTSDTHAFDALVRLLDNAGLPELILPDVPILIKPNLVEALAPPITTPPSLIAALIRYLRGRVNNDIIIGEGSAATSYDTYHTFSSLGYDHVAKKLDVSLIDLNCEPSVYLKNEHCLRWPDMYLPRLALDSFLLSVPVLKAHSMAQVTLTMKNMMGLAPPEHFQQGGGWRKSAFHLGIQDAIADLNRYRTPDFTLLDATIGMAEAHLWGPVCDPPVGILAAGSDPVAIDAYGSGLLGKSWQKIDHIAQVHGELGLAEPLTLLEA